MSRFDAEFRAAAETQIDLEELLGAFSVAAAGSASRNDAMARFLSGADGWRDAGALLQGAFAGSAPKASRLTDDKDR